MGVSLISKDSDFSAGNIGWRGVILATSALNDHLYALHAFGTDHKTVFASDDARPQARGDYSFHGRHLAQVGAPVVGTNNVTLGLNDYYVMPFTGDDIGGVSNHVTLFCVAKLPNVGAQPIGCYNSNGVASIDIDRGSTGALHALANQDGAGVTVAAISADADTGVLYEFLVMTDDGSALKLYRKTANIDNTPASTAVSLPPRGAQQMRIGRSISTGGFGLTATHNVAIAGCYTRALAADEVTALRDDLRAYLGALAHPIII